MTQPNQLKVSQNPPDPQRGECYGLMMPLFMAKGTARFADGLWVMLTNGSFCASVQVA
jgi:hypothetical protein